MGTKADEYWRKADEAETQAAQAQDERAKTVYRDVAAQLRRMVEQAERQGW